MSVFAKLLLGAVDRVQALALGLPHVHQVPRPDDHLGHRMMRQTVMQTRVSLPYQEVGGRCMGAGDAGAAALLLPKRPGEFLF